MKNNVSRIFHFNPNLLYELFRTEYTFFLKSHLSKYAFRVHSTKLNNAKPRINIFQYTLTTQIFIYLVITSNIDCLHKCALCVFGSTITNITLIWISSASKYSIKLSQNNSNIIWKPFIFVSYCLQKRSYRLKLKI